MSTEPTQHARYQELIETVRAETAVGLSDHGMQEVWRRLRPAHGRIGGIRRRWLLLPAAAVMAASIGVFFWARQPNVSSLSSAVVCLELAEVVRESGEVSRTDGYGVRKPLGTAVMAPGETASLGEGARLDVRFGVLAHLSLVGPATVAFSLDGQWEIQRGLVHLWVNPNRGSEPFWVRAGNDQIIVHGTSFSVYVDDEAHASVLVRRGVVTLQRQTEPDTTIGAGTTIGPEERRLDRLAGSATDLDGPWWQSDTSDGDVGSLIVDTVPQHATVHLDDWELGQAPLFVRRSAGEAELKVTAAAHSPSVRQAHIAPGQTTRIFAELERLAPPATPATPATRREPTEAQRMASPRPLDEAASSAAANLDSEGPANEALSCAQLEERARAPAGALDKEAVATRWMGAAECYLRQGEREEALRAFLEVTRSASATTRNETAWFEVARLQRELGARQAAEAALERYLELFPGGRFAADASLRRCELRVEARELETARRCLEEYLREYPGEVRNAAALRLLAAVCRAAGDFSAARKSYEALLRRSDLSDSDAEEARYRLVEVIERGRLPGLREACEDYLEHHPRGRYADQVRRAIP